MLLSVVLAVVLCHGTGMVTKTKPFPNVIPPHQDLFIKLFITAIGKGTQAACSHGKFALGQTTVMLLGTC